MKRKKTFPKKALPSAAKTAQQSRDKKKRRRKKNMIRHIVQNLNYLLLTVKKS